MRLSKQAHMALIVAHAALALLFLVALLQKLQGHNPADWIVILAPLYIANGLRTFAKCVEMVRLQRLVDMYDNVPDIQRIGIFCYEVPREAVLFFVPTVLDFLDNAGECMATVLIGLYLDRVLMAHITIILFPLWVQVVCGSVIRCCPCVDPVADARSRASKRIAGAAKSLGYIMCKALPAALISLRLDGILHVRWTVVFAPWWLVTTGLALASCMLCCFASTLDPLRQNEALDPAARQHFSRSWNCMVKGMASYLMIIDALAVLFLFRLASWLEGGTAKGKYVLLLTPLFALYGIMLLLSPPLYLANAKIDEFRRDIELAQLYRDEADEEQNIDIEHARARRERRARRVRRPLMQVASRNLFLLRHSSTVFTRSHQSKDLRENAEQGPAGEPCDEDENKPCYVCMSSHADGVLMECGHGGLCYQCGLELARKGQQCPLCRSVIEEVLHIDTKSLSSGVARSFTQVTVKHDDASGRAGQSEDPPSGQADHLRRSGIAV